VSEDLQGVLRMMRAFATGRLPVAALRRQLGRDPVPALVPGVPVGLTRQAVRFAAIGVASTLAYLVLFVALRGELGAQGANVLALLLTAVANTATNRRLTFGVRGAQNVARSQVEGLVVFAVGLALTSGALAALGAWDPHASRPVEVGVLVGANLVATVVRFLLFRAWVFHPRRQQAAIAGAVPVHEGHKGAVLPSALPASEEAV
jgi:putative flippase GtrA